MRIADDPPASQPEWLLTYGDLMSLLLTIFVMLVSMGELKQTDKFQGVADSLHEQFGGSESQFGLLPGGMRPRNSMLAAAAVGFRMQRTVAMGGDQSPVEPGNRATSGTAIQFTGEDAALSEQHQTELRSIAAMFIGKPHSIEVRGQVFDPPAPAAGSDAWELAYRRGRATMQFLVDELGVEKSRIRLTTASFTEARLPADHASVEILVLEGPPAQP